MLKTSPISLLLLTAALSLQATDFYVAPSPIATGDGSINNPWDLQTALHATGTVRPGDTIWVKGGVHRRSFTDASGVYGPMPTKFDSTLTGAAGNNIVVRAMPGQRATIDGNLQQKSGGYVTFRDLEIMDSLPGRYTTQAGPWPTTWQITQNGKLVEFCVSGVDIGGNPDQGAAWVPGMQFINCVVHDNIGGGFGMARSSAGMLVHGCLVYYNGWRGYNTVTYAAQNHGHGFYIQHAGTTQTVVQDTFSFENFSQGAQYYGTTAGYADYGTYDGVAMWQNSHFQPTQQRNMEYGNAAGVACMRPSIINSMVYDSRPSMSDSEFGDGSGMNYCTFTNNYFGTPVNFNGALINTVAFAGNSFLNGVSGSINSSSYPGNGNVFQSTQPTSGAKIAVYPNLFEVGRGNIVIFNWGQASTVNVDVSKLGLVAGDQYELHQANDYYNDISYGTYMGTPITINMTGHTVAVPVGYAATGNVDSQVLTPDSTFPRFGSFVIMKKSGAPVANTAPTVTTIANQTTQSGVPTAPLSFTVGDAQTAAGSLTVSASSSNPLLVPNTGIVLGGSGAARTVTVTPALNSSGAATITLTVSDGSLSTSTSFTLTVTAPNTPPTITSIASQTVVSGSSTAPIAFTVNDAETAAGSLVVTAASSNPTLTPSTSLVLGGSGSSRTLTITPAAGQTGTATITVKVSDGQAATSASFTLTVTAPNTPPAISSIGNQTVAAGHTTAPIAFTVNDAQTAAGSLVVTASSSNPTLVPAAGLVLGGTGSTRTLTITPAAGQTGTAAITVKVSDGQATASTSFTLTVDAAPVISAIPNQTTPQNTATVPIAFTVSDAETAASNLVVTAASSNATLVPSANIALGGSGSSRTLTITPAAGQSGTATITVSVRDAIDSASASFQLNVTSTTVTNTPSTPVVIGFEAESGVIASPMRVVVDPTMPTRSYIQSTVSGQGTATYNVTVPVAGNYVMWCKVLAPSYTNDSFFVSVDGAEDVYDEAEGRQSPYWQWTEVNGRNGTGIPNTLNPRIFALTQGQHTIVFRGREAYASIDRVILCNDLTYVPHEVTCGNDTVAAVAGATTQIDLSELLANDSSLFGDVLKISAVGVTTNGTVSLANGVISYTPNTGSVATDTFSYTATDGMGGNGSGTVTVSVAATNSVRLGYDAESGIIASPMVVMTDTTTPARRYIWSTTANQGSATYNISVPKSGTYVMWCKILSPSWTNDSFFVTVDGAQDVFDTSEGTHYSYWHWTELNGRAGTGVPLTLNPRTLNLTQGNHQIVVGGREAWTGLDRFIITDDINFVPQDLVAINDAVSAIANASTSIATSTLLRNDYSLFSDPFTITSVGSAQNGTVALSGTAIAYTPKAGFTGQDTFTYTIADNQGSTATATVTVTVK